MLIQLPEPDQCTIQKLWVALPPAIPHFYTRLYPSNFLLLTTNLDSKTQSACPGSFVLRPRRGQEVFFEFSNLRAAMARTEQLIVPKGATHQDTKTDGTCRYLFKLPQCSLGMLGPRYVKISFCRQSHQKYVNSAQPNIWNSGRVLQSHSLTQVRMMFVD